MVQKSSKKQAEEAVLDLKGKLRQLNKVLASKGAVVAENAPLVDTIKAVEGLKAQAPLTITIFKELQFWQYVDAELPPMRIAESYKQANLSYCFAQNNALKSLPTVENIDMAINMSSYASGCTSIIEVSLGALTNATNISGAFSGCTSLASVTIGAMPKATKAQQIFSGCPNLKDVSIDLSGGLLTDFVYAFFNCTTLQRVKGVIDLTNATSVHGAFQGCPSLEEVRIKGLKASIDLSACANLSLESVRYLLENVQEVSSQRIDLSRKLLEANEEELEDLGDTASGKGWTIGYK